MVSSYAQTAAAAVPSLLLHTYTRPSIASSPWMVPPPRVRSSGCIDHGQTPVGVAVSPVSQQNIKSRCAVDSILFRSRSADKYLEAGLDASPCMVASCPEWKGVDMLWGILPVDCREDGTLRQTVSSANAPARETARMSMWLALTVQVWSCDHWEM